MTRFAVACVLVLATFMPSAHAAEKAMPDATVAAYADGSLIVALAFSPDGTRLASVGGHNVLKVWDVAARKELYAINGFAEDRNLPKFSPDGKRLYARGRGSAVMVVDVEAEKALSPVPVPDLPGGVSAIDLSADGKTLAGGTNEGKIHSWTVGG